MPEKKARIKNKELGIKAAANRRIKQPQYKTLHLSKRIQQPKAKLPSSYRLMRESLGVLKRNWKLFGGIVAVYLLLTIMLVKGFGVGSDIGELKDALQEAFQGRTAEIATSLALFSVLLGNASSTASEVAGAYQSLLLVVTSLVLIWALRQTGAAKKTSVTVRDAFYKGLYPLVPFLLVLLVIGLQLLPLLTASFLYSIVFGGGLAVTPIEQGLWACLLFMLIVLSLYMITSSVFALYIVTLPDMRPMQALRSARELVRFRRWVIMRKFLFLPSALIVVSALIMVPLIIISPAFAEWLFFVMSMLALAVVHSYMYRLYRELIV